MHWTIEISIAIEIWIVQYMTFYIYSLTDLKKYDILTGQVNAEMSDHSRWMPMTSAKKN